MSAAFLVLVAGLGSLLATSDRLNPTQAQYLAWFWASLALPLGIAGLGIHWAACVVLVALARLWCALLPRRSDMVGPRSVRTVGCGVAMVAGPALALGLDSVLVTGNAPLAGAWDTVRAPALDAVPLELLVAGLGVVTLLGPASNRITSAMLAVVRSSDPGPEPASRPVLRGGRIIGPLERLLLLALGTAGAFPVIAALLAAKGIVRFPEISQDSTLGSKAEEFLIGSLTSWSLACAGTLLLVASGS